LQLEIERDHFTETTTHEIECHRQALADEETKRERYLDLQAENEKLLHTIDFLIAQINYDGHKHAVTLHDMNKQMRILRQQMEKKFLKELSSMDVSYQQNAFGSLTEKQKKSMFQNAKLKDEVALQGVGIANLSARLIRQKQSYDSCKKSLRSLNRKSRNLREQLAELAVGRNQLFDDIKSIEHQEQLLLAAKSKLLLEIEASHGTFSLETIKEKRREIEEEIVRQNLKFSMWNRRLFLFQQLFAEIKPATTAEVQGLFKSSVFSIDRSRATSTTAISSHSILNHNIDHNSYSLSHNDNVNAVSGAQSLQRQESAASNISATSSFLSADPREIAVSACKHYKLTDIEQMIESDRMLSQALLPLKGKESCLVSNQEDDDDEQNVTILHDAQKTKNSTMQEGAEAVQNMIAWITFKVTNGINL
jgi:hypothetical protein